MSKSKKEILEINTSQVLILKTRLKMQTEVLVEKINQLPLNRIAEVEDFVDFLTQREERRLVDSATTLSAEVFREVWDNEEDAIYDII